MFGEIKGGKLIQAVLLSFWSICGLFQLLPTIKTRSDIIQAQVRKQRKWGKNVIRCECFIRLLLSVVLYTKYWVMRNWKFEFEHKFVVYTVLIAFALYPYAIELLFQTPLSLLCRGSFFLIHHIDPLTSLPNIYRFNKDVQSSRMRWKLGMIITNVRKFSLLNEKFGAKCADITLTKFMQRIVFEMEDNSSIKMKLYRIKDDRFLIITGFPTEDEFKEFVVALSQIEITVQRPSDYDENNEKQRKKDDDADVENQKDAVEPDDDFINPNANSGYGDDNGGGGNWYDDDEDENKEDEDGDGKKPTGSTLKIPKGRRRKMSSYNKSTADESMVMGLRIAGSYGPFCNLGHVMSLDAQLKEDDKSGQIERDYEKYKIDELKDHDNNNHHNGY